MKPLVAIFGPPMAAPETPALKAARLTIIAACTVMVMSIGAIGTLRVVVGDVASLLPGTLLLVLGVLVPLYLRAKLRADDAHLDHLIASGELGSAEGEAK